MPADPQIKLQRVAADYFLLAVIRPAQSAGYHAAHVMTRFEESGGEPFPRGGDRGHDAAGGAAVDHDIEAMGGAQRSERQC